MFPTLKKYYTGSFIFTVVAILICYAVAGLQGAFLAAILGVLETSVSLDNAVVNAKVLKDLDHTWRHRFLTWGMVFSVFFVRVLFPILIVWGTSSLSLVQSATLPFENAQLYAATVSVAHVKIAGFGGSFLLMVFLAFMMDEEKEQHWIPGIETLLSKLSGFGNWGIVLLAGIIEVVVQYLVIPVDQGFEFAVASSAGTASWLAVQYLGEKLGGGAGVSTAAKSGLGMFIYLNVLDATFSFDGVVGAFAVSNSIILIGLGLGIGSMFVRSMTIHMVEKDTLGGLPYLEHGAFWSIGVLTAMMFAGTVVDIPEVVSGLSAAIILGIAVVHSLIANKAEAKAVTA
jgi:hypothetical protein